MAKFKYIRCADHRGYRKLVGIITNRDLKFETDFYEEDSVKSMTSEKVLITAPAGNYSRGSKEDSWQRQERKSFLS